MDRVRGIIGERSFVLHSPFLIDQTKSERDIADQLRRSSKQEATLASIHSFCIPAMLDLKIACRQRRLPRAQLPLSDAFAEAHSQ